MTKAEFVAKLAAQGDTTKKHAAEALETVFGAISKELASGEQVSIPGFGKFSVVKRSARTGINPRTKKKMKIKAVKVPRFAAAKALKESVK
jgi:DNA-binding protein HU-beta